MKRVSRLLVLCILFFSCEQKELRQDSYLQYYSSDEHLNTKTITAGNIIYTLKILPAEYFVLKEFNSTEHTDSFKKRLTDIQDNTYFLLKINSGSTGTMDPEEKAKLVSYYQNQSAKRMELIVNSSETIRPSYVNYEDNYGLSPDNRLLVCFPYNSKNAKQLLFRYDDPVFNNTNVQASFPAELLSKMPSLKL